jgi:hypothetical protein
MTPTKNRNEWVGFGRGGGLLRIFFPPGSKFDLVGGGQIWVWGRLGGVPPSHFWSPDFCGGIGWVKRGGQVGEILLYS